MLPLRILYHRGRFYLGCRLEQENRYLFLDLTYLGNISVRTQSFHLSDKLKKLNQAKQELFGVTENANHTQRVVLEFSSETGDFVRHTVWDALGVNAEDLELEPVGKSQPYNWRMSFDCGINRELVGWIFSWMSNVKVIKPASLRNKVQEVAQRMIDVNSGKIYLRYENLFPALP